MKLEQLLEELDEFLEENYGEGINSLYEQGAGHYFAMCRYTSHSGPINGDRVIEGIESDEFNQFDQQSIMMDKLEEFEQKLGSKGSLLWEALDSIKDEVKSYLLEYSVDDIVSYVNESDDHDWNDEDDEEYEIECDRCGCPVFVDDVDENEKYYCDDCEDEEEDE